MSLTKHQIKLIKHSWQSLQGVNPGLIADIFYSRLFADHPGLKKLFPANMHQQYTKLLDTLTSIITRLDRPDKTLDEIQALARRHVEYGVKPKHYQYAGEALLWTLKQGLGSDWTPELAAAWQTAYSEMAGAMLDAVQQKIK